MGLFSFLRKNKQENASSEGEYYSRAEADTAAARGRSKRKASSPDEATDPVLPEKKRARRRLIGAIALVLAAVIGLPMILDSEPKPVVEDIVIQIPSKDKPADGRIRASLPTVPAAAGLDQAEQLVESAALPIEGQDLKKAGVDTKPSVPEKVEKIEKAEATVKSDEKTALTSEPRKTPAEPIAPSKIEPTIAKSDDGARAQAILEGRAEPRAAANAKPGSYVVQVAALASQEKITELRDKLKQAGLPSHTQKVATESGERTRVRVGPFASKEEAEKARAKLGKIGLNGTLVPTGR